MLGILTLPESSLTMQWHAQTCLNVAASFIDLQLRELSFSLLAISLIQTAVGSLAGGCCCFLSPAPREVLQFLSESILQFLLL